MHALAGSSTLRRNYIQFNQGYGVYIGSNPINLGTALSNGRNFIRYNNNNEYQIYSTSSASVSAIGNFWQSDDANEIDNHIWDNEEDYYNAEVNFNPWYYRSLHIPDIRIESQGNSIALIWDYVMDMNGNPGLIEYYCVEYYTNPYAPEPVWNLLGQTVTPSYIINPQALPNATFFRVTAVELSY